MSLASDTGRLEVLQATRLLDSEAEAHRAQPRLRLSPQGASGEAGRRF
jgi:hypothetical protein